MVFEGVPGGPMDCWGDVDDARGAPREEQVDPRDVPAVGGRAVPEHRAHRRQRHPRRPLPADRAQAGRRAPVGRARARAGGRRRAQRPDHRPGLEQREQGGRRRTSRASASTATGRSTAASWSRRSSATGTYAQYVTDLDERAARRRRRQHVLELLGAGNDQPGDRARASSTASTIRATTSTGSWTRRTRAATWPRTAA